MHQVWVLLSLVLCLPAPAVRPPGTFTSVAPPAHAPITDDVLINELDADQSGVDTQEFIELLAPAEGWDLSGLMVVLYNGAADGDAAYDAIDLSGQIAGAGGLFLIGSVAVDGVDLVAFNSNGIQNGPDAVALWYAPDVSAADFMGTSPLTPPTGAGPRPRLIDAVVHATNDAPDLALIAALTPGASMRDENAGLGPSERSLQRRPDGGEPFDADRFIPSAPTPGRRNGNLQHVAIHEIQGPGHRSPIEGSYVADVEGVVTAVRSDRFHLQEIPGLEDDDPNTSEALVVLHGATPSPEIGDHLRLTGWVEEHRPGGALNNLTTTRLVLLGDWALLASGLVLPDPIVLGKGGRMLPDRIIDDDTRTGKVETGATLFDPESDGLDAFEALEGMRVQVRKARAVSATSKFGELVVVSDDGEVASGLAPRGTLLRGPDDVNPERITVDDAILDTPEVAVGDRFDLPLTGVMGYSFGNPKLLLTEPVLSVGGASPAERATPAGPGVLSIASLNVQNLSPKSEGERVAELAETIVFGLQAPDLVALQEVQDGSGSLNDGVVSGLPTLMLLQGAIRSLGGPQYLAVEIAPIDGMDGGQPGGNIRVAFLYRADGDLSLPARMSGTAETPVAVEPGLDGEPHLRPNPGRIDPADPAWERSRKPLAAEFEWRGRSLFVVTVHFASKLGDTPLFGAWQPPVTASHIKRIAQARVVRIFVEKVLARSPDAALVVLGDCNDYEWSATLAELQTGGQLVNLTDRIPRDDRGSYIYEGNAQTLDHALVTHSLVGPALDAGAGGYRIVHRHAGRLDAPSDHDPILLRLDLEPFGTGPR